MERENRPKEKRYCRCGRETRPDGCGICQVCLYEETLQAKEAKNPAEKIEGWAKI